MRAAVYSGTRNIYQDMMTAAKSLLEHSNVEKIYFLIEDDIFPYALPPEIECINVSNQTYFPKNGPNYKNVCTYMVLLRAAYTKIFPQLDRILSIDMDTIVNENISNLWELDLTEYYIAAVEEAQLTKAEGSYFNMGVAMLNLKKIREDHMDDALIEALNIYWYRYKEQDCFNEFFRGHSLILPSDYNVCIQANEPRREKITHFAGIYKMDLFPHFNHYKNLSWNDVQYNQPDNITLDIIIPTYKNKNALRRTLNSFQPNNLVNVIVVDDCSNMDYSDILNEYPYIHFYTLPENSGPGVARQYGVEHSNGTYICFLDSGDYFYNDGINTILTAIQENTYIKLYTFSYIYDDKNILMDRTDDKTIGSVYKRSFIEMYNIHFSKEGSYANEDYGFSRACKIIIDFLEEEWHFHPMTKHIYMPTFCEHIDKNSLTKSNNNEFFYKKLPAGIIINGIHAINIAEKANVSVQYIIKELCHIMAQEYFFFLSIVQERPELADEIWELIRNFYFNYYRTYSKFSYNTLKIYFKSTSLPKIYGRVNSWQKKITFNIDRFIKELETEYYTPLRYLT